MVTLAASKVEVKLKKAEPKKWRTLNIEQNGENLKSTSNKTDDEKVAQEDLENRIDAVDLSDL